MNMETMKVKNLLDLDIDIDIYDDYDERCGIAFCGSVELTKEGKAKFKDALSLSITIYNMETAIVHCKGREEAEAAAELFNSLAGYCTTEEWDTWFEV